MLAIIAEEPRLPAHVTRLLGDYRVLSARRAQSMGSEPGRIPIREMLDWLDACSHRDQEYRAMFVRVMVELDETVIADEKKRREESREPEPDPAATETVQGRSSELGAPEPWRELA